MLLRQVIEGPADMLDFWRRWRFAREAGREDLAIDALIHPELREVVGDDVEVVYRFVLYARTGRKEFVKVVPNRELNRLILRYGDKTQHSSVRAMVSELSDRQRRRENWIRLGSGVIGAASGAVTGAIAGAIVSAFRT